MRSCLRETDTLARFGGDEFVMLLTSASGSEEEVARQTTARIFESLKNPINIGEAGVHIGASCGISFFPRHTSESDELFNLADKALYIAKRTGKNRSLIWSPEVEEF
jgi:diguanylate cyclase (GGDEF)-like protein